jgi:hypothetical protein
MQPWQMMGTRDRCTGKAIAIPAQSSGQIRCGRSMMLGPHVRGWITLLVRRICALCPAWVVDDG